MKFAKMFNEQRVDEVREKIRVSTLLSDHEKGDWLNLLELMNDKQLGELEEILASGGTASAMPKPAAPTPSPASKMPQLSHIANIPTDLSMKSPIAPTPAVQAVRPQGSPSSSFAKPQLRPEPKTEPKTEPRAQFVPPPAELPNRSPKPSFDVEHLDDLQSVSIETLRKYDLQSMVNVVRVAIQQYGYFRILQLIEASPLYKAYLQSGEEQLKMPIGKPSDNNKILTRAEFEFMTDLLSHMRFNRW